MGRRLGYKEGNVVTSSMQAALLAAPGRLLEMRQIPTPTPGAGELLIKLEACGLCHTDVHIQDAAAFPPGAPA